MQNEIAVNTEILGRKVSDLDGELSGIRSGINQMFDAVAELDTMWDGPANDAFRQQFLLDKNEMQDLCKELEGIFHSMDNAKKEYEQCENDVRQLIAEIRI